MKLETPIHILTKGLPEEFKDYLNYVRCLDYEVEPDYRRLRSMFMKLFKTKGYNKQIEFDWTKYSEDDNEDDQEELESSNSSFDPMESKLREFQFQKIQKELKRNDFPNEIKEALKGSSDLDQSASDISENEAEENKLIWESQYKIEEFGEVSNREQGKLRQSYIEEEKCFTRGVEKQRSPSKGKMSILDTRKAKSSFESKPVLISAGFLALGNKNNKIRPKVSNSQHFPKLKHKTNDDYKTSGEGQSKFFTEYKLLEDEYLIHEVSFEDIKDEGIASKVKIFSHRGSVHLNDIKLKKISPIIK